MVLCFLGKIQWLITILSDSRKIMKSESRRRQQKKRFKSKPLINSNKYRQKWDKKKVKKVWVKNKTKNFFLISIFINFLLDAIIYLLSDWITWERSAKKCHARASQSRFWLMNDRIMGLRRQLLLFSRKKCRKNPSRARKFAMQIVKAWKLLSNVFLFRQKSHQNWIEIHEDVSNGVKYWGMMHWNLFFRIISYI